MTIEQLWCCVLIAIGYLEDVAAITTSGFLTQMSLMNMSNDTSRAILAQAVVDDILGLQATFLRIYQMLLKAPEGAGILYRLDEEAETLKGIKCPNIPKSSDKLPVILVESCIPADNSGFETQLDCENAYDAYVRWCQPIICHTVMPKPRYLAAMQVMAAIGGMYSIFNLFAFAILRRLCCQLEKLIQVSDIRLPTMLVPSTLCAFRVPLCIAWCRRHRQGALGAAHMPPPCPNVNREGNMQCGVV